jgi:hypothetical protein
MSIENEIKIVLNPDFNAKALKGWELKKIRQGYLGNTAHLIREDKNHFLVYRDWVGTTRKELEIRIPVDKNDFDDLWQKCTDKHTRDFFQGKNQSVIETGRLTSTPRIRQYGDQYLFTYKDWVTGEDVRIEIEDEITKKAFEALWPNCHGTMYKDRYVKVKNNIEWVVDFMREGDSAGPVYFVLAEAEMPEGMIKPDKTIKAIRDDVLFEVPKGNKDFSSRKLCDKPYAEKKLEEIRIQP